MTQLCWLGRTLKKYWTTGEQRTSFNSCRAARCDVSWFMLCSVVNLIVSIIAFWRYMRFLHIAHPQTSPFLHDGGHLRLQKQHIPLFFNCTTAFRVEREMEGLHWTGRLVLARARVLTFGDLYSFIPLFALSQLLSADFLDSRNILSRSLSLLAVNAPWPKYVSYLILVVRSFCCFK